MFGNSYKSAKGLWGKALLSALLAIEVASFSTVAQATITQGDFSIFGTLSSRWSGRWGLKESNLIPCNRAVGACVSAYPFNPTHYSGGSYDFARWDLVQARQVADLLFSFARHPTA